MATKKQNKRGLVRQARSVLNRAEVCPTHTRNGIHRIGYGAGLCRSHVRVDMVDSDQADWIEMSLYQGCCGEDCYDCPDINWQDFQIANDQPDSAIMADVWPKAA